MKTRVQPADQRASDTFGTVKNRIFRAREILKRELADILEVVRYNLTREGFEVDERPNGALVIEADSYARYDLVAQVFASLDTDGTVALYRELKPLIDEAYEHLRVHGRLYLVLMRTAGVRRHMKHVFGNCETAAHSGKYTVLTAERTM